MTPLRMRLFNPPNAVPDTGFNFHNGRPFKPHLEVVAKEPPVVIVLPKKKRKALSVKNNHPTVAGGVPREDAPIVARFGMREIRIVTCEVWGISEYEMLSARRTREYFTPRQVAVALSARFTMHSMPAIGRSFMRDHTTVLFAVRKMAPILKSIESQLSESSSIVEWARAIKARLGDREGSEISQ